MSTLPEAKQSRPSAGNTGAAETSPREVTLSLTDLDAYADHINGVFVVLVTTLKGGYHRRCFLSLRSAQRAAEKARERGQTATITLCELKPLFHVGGDAS